MKELFILIRKDFVIDWRQQSPFTGILLYLFSTIFTTYMAFGGLISTTVWNAIFWIVLLFTAINAISKSFTQEERRNHYYFFLCSPSLIIGSKLVYSFAYLIILSVVAIIVFSVLFGIPDLNLNLYFINLLLGCIGLSSAFTLIAAISAKASNKSVLMAVLGFPVIIPVLILAISNANKIMDGFVWVEIQGNMLSLLSIDVIIIALSFVLFPFTWRS